MKPRPHAKQQSVTMQERRVSPSIRTALVALACLSNFAFPHVGCSHVAKFGPEHVRDSVRPWGRASAAAGEASEPKYRALRGGSQVCWIYSCVGWKWCMECVRDRLIDAPTGECNHVSLYMYAKEDGMYCVVYTVCVRVRVLVCVHVNLLDNTNDAMCEYKCVTISVLL